MQITIKLYAMLSEYLPTGAVKNVGTLQIEENTTVGAVVKQLQLPRELVHLVLLNGVYVAPDNHFETRLQEADTLAIWPPVAGG